MPVATTQASALAAEHAVLLSAEAEAWRSTSPHPEGTAGHDAAMTRWAMARTALDAFPARLAAIGGPDPELARLKARVLLAIHRGELDFAVEAALAAAHEDDSVAEEALALSIARDLLTG